MKGGAGNTSPTQKKINLKGNKNVGLGESKCEAKYGSGPPGGWAPTWVVTTSALSCLKSEQPGVWVPGAHFQRAPPTPS